MADRELAALKKQRSCNKGRLTNILNYLRNANDAITIEDLRTRLSRVEQLMSEFTAIESKMFLLDITEESDYVYEDNHYEAVTTINTLIRSKSMEAGNASFETSFTKPLVHQFQVQLPKINIPPFSGDYTEWQSFYDIFSSTIHESPSLNPVQKFQYLKGYLRGEASVLLKHISITEANYIGALSKLKERYDRKRHIINSFVRTFVEQPSITTSTAANVKKLMDTSDEVIRGLRALGECAEKRDPWLIFLLVQKLDEKSKTLWAENIVDLDNPTIEKFLDFLARRVDTLETTSKLLKHQAYKPIIKGHIATEQAVYTCAVCKENEHSLFACKLFNEMDVLTRREWAKSSQRCFNCLSKRHQISKCTSKRSCQQCKKRHHSLLHLEETTPPLNSNQPSSSPKDALSLNSQIVINHSILPTALINIKDYAGNTVVCRALLDSGSQTSFITEKCVQRFGFRRINARLSVAGLGCSNAGSTKGLVKIALKPDHHPEFYIEALILPKITSRLPCQTIEGLKFNHISNLQLADPQFYKSAEIDVLIGADHFFSILRPGQVKTKVNGPVLQETIFGWVVSEKCENSTLQCNLASMLSTSEKLNSNLDKTLRNFWEIESVPNSTNILSPEENFCESHFIENVRKSNEGRFIVQLPLKKSPQVLGKSINLAIQRLRGIERRFLRDPEFYKLYQDFMAEYLQLNHMVEINQSNVNDPGYYLPHHGVLKPSSSTSKLRVVFDGSAITTSGISLNDCLAIGPTVQATLYSIILRFREHQFVVVADVEKMYRQVQIASDDTNYQRIVWRNKPSEPIRHFRLTTVTYGLASASFLATRVLKKIADDNQSKFPVASTAISQDIYVDDLMTGSNTESKVIELKDTIKMLLSIHGFNLRKWMSNFKAILRTENADAGNNIKTINGHQQDNLKSIKILGINWNPTTDQFTFSSELPNNESFTKRIVVSEASRLFDPIGWIAPVVVVVKIFVQKLWAINLNWDDPLPDEISKQWRKVRSELSHVSIISIPRCIPSSEHDQIQIHGFSDASQNAYGAVVYMRIQTSDGKAFVHLISAKTKVSPIKQVSLPRLELCAAVLLTSLIKLIQHNTNKVISETYAWTDSQVVLDWLSSHPRRWSTFVGNRTAEIISTLSRNQWHHVPSSDNPADCASRGMLPNELHQHQLWWNGPQWLHQSSENWPLQTTKYGFTEEENSKSFTFAAVIETNLLDELIQRYSSFTKLQRVLAYILRFIIRSKYKKESTSLGFYLQRNELFQALTKLCRYDQNKYYREEIIQLQSKKGIKKSSCLQSLNPILDSDGVLRVGGRLENSEACFSTKHPIILHPKSHLSLLIVNEIHNNNKHAGPSLTLSITRQNYWIPSSRNLVRQVINKCIVCAKYKTKIQDQVMGNLPTSRVELVRPFLKIRVDFAGPFLIHLRKGRGQRVYKAYLCLFICLSTKAVHLEVVGDMTTDAFLGALKRFTSRRGVCRDIYSDNGSNFIGANNSLQENFNKLIKKSKIICDYSSRQFISWHFNPPSTPHFGGIWEAGIKSAKYHLKRVIGNTILTFEEMCTLTAEIEGILNSRPICALHSTDIDILTPSHFILGHAVTKIPENDITDLKPTYLTRWQMIQQLTQHFWRRWQIEYLTSLQPRTKWRDGKTSIKIDDVVVIRDTNTPVNQWPLARVVKIHPGADDIIRVVTLKTKSGEIKRPTNKLIILPLARDEPDIDSDQPIFNKSKP